MHDVIWSDKIWGIICIIHNYIRGERSAIKVRILKD